MSDPLNGRHLCHINLAKGFRGGERQTQILIGELAARGVRQSLITREHSALGDRCQDIPGLAISKASTRILGAALRARQADVIHAHEAHAFYSAALAHLFNKTPYVLTRRVPNPQKPSIARTITYGWAGKLTGVSQAVEENIRVRYPVIEVEVVPDAHASLTSDEAAVTDIRSQFPGKVLVGHVGALDDAHKGTRTILAAARRAAVEKPDWQFLICGDGKDEAALKAEAADLDNVTFTGFIDNVGDYLASFDVFVFPSRYEALGSSVLDAMHFGLPVVATNVGGIPEFVDDGVNGYLIEPDDSDALVERVAETLANSHQRELMAAANRAKAALYDAKRMADAYVAIYQGLLP